MAPTRELVVQIGKDIRMFTRALDFTCVCAYGGSAVGDQISALKRGAEVILYSLSPNLCLIEDQTATGQLVRGLTRPQWALLKDGAHHLHMCTKKRILPLSLDGECQ